MIILALDPGPKQSAIVEWDGQTIRHARIADNETILAEDLPTSQADILVIEQIKSYGMSVADTVFDTVFWSGRFAQAWKGPWARVPRMQVKLHHCKDSRAKDGNVRQALIDRLGERGTKKNPGLTYGLKADEWQALALAVAYYDWNYKK